MTENKQRAVGFLLALWNMFCVAGKQQSPDGSQMPLFLQRQHRNRNPAIVMKVRIIKDTSVICQMPEVWK